MKKIDKITLVVIGSYILLHTLNSLVQISTCPKSSYETLRDELLEAQDSAVALTYQQVPVNNEISLSDIKYVVIENGNCSYFSSEIHCNCDSLSIGYSDDSDFTDDYSPRAYMDGDTLKISFSGSIFDSYIHLPGNNLRYVKADMGYISIFNLDTPELGVTCSASDTSLHFSLEDCNIDTLTTTRVNRLKLENTTSSVY
ncbi:MAG: hypothetical protein ACI30M_05730 [Muribaculaceae bacterium]